VLGENEFYLGTSEGPHIGIRIIPAGYPRRVIRPDHMGFWAAFRWIGVFFELDLFRLMIPVIMKGFDPDEFALFYIGFYSITINANSNEAKSFYNGPFRMTFFLFICHFFPFH
jgi:hypothetical protein